MGVYPRASQDCLRIALCYPTLSESLKPMSINPFNPPKPFYTVEDLAARIGLSADWIYRAWQKMVDSDGLPTPIVSVSARGGRAPLKWDARGIEIWLALKQPPAVRVAMGLPPHAPANDIGPDTPPEYQNGDDALDRFMV